MTVPSDKQCSALLVIDPYNDFISEGGKVWDRLKAVAEANECVPHMLQVLNAARNAGLRIFYALYHRYRPGDYRHGQIFKSSQLGLSEEHRPSGGGWRMSSGKPSAE